MAESNIEEYLKLVIEAVYGKDVRQAIYDSIKQCYADGKAGSIDLIARQSLSELSSNVENLEKTVMDLEFSGGGSSGETYNYVGDLPQTPTFRPVYLLANEDTTLSMGENKCSGIENLLINGTEYPYTGNVVFYENVESFEFNDTNGVTFTRKPSVAQWQNAFLLFAVPAEIGKTYTLSAEFSNAYMRLAETDSLSNNIGISTYTSSYSAEGADGRQVTSITASMKYVLIQVFTKSTYTTTVDKIMLTTDGTTTYQESKSISLVAGEYTEYANAVGETIPAGGVTIGLYQKTGGATLTSLYNYLDEKLATKLDSSGYTETGNLVVDKDGLVKVSDTSVKNDKVYAFLGDSIPTFDANTGGYGAIPDYMQKLVGGTWHNFGIGGTTMGAYSNTSGTYQHFTFGALADAIAGGDFSAQETGVSNGVGAGSTSYSASEKVADMKSLDWSTVDTLFVHFGTNDLAYGNDVGTANDEESKDGTMCASLKYAVNKILSAYPQMKIVICGIIFRYADNPSVSKIIGANEIIKECCYQNGTPFVDLFGEMGINTANRTTFLYDGTHPNVNGKIRYAECLVKHI